MSSIAQGVFRKDSEGFFLTVKSSEWTTLFVSSMLQEALFSQYGMKKVVSISLFPPDVTVKPFLMLWTVSKKL